MPRLARRSRRTRLRRTGSCRMHRTRRLPPRMSAHAKARGYPPRRRCRKVRARRRCTRMSSGWSGSRTAHGARGRGSSCPCSRWCFFRTLLLFPPTLAQSPLGSRGKSRVPFPRGEEGCRQLNHQVLPEREREVCRRGGGHIIDAPTNSLFVRKFAIDREARSPLRGMATIIVKLSWTAGSTIDE